MGDGGVDGEPGGEGEAVRLAPLTQLAGRRHHVAAGRGVVAKHCPVGRKVFPVRGSQLKKLNGVRLHVDT